jgi:hypothetical protein
MTGGKPESAKHSSLLQNEIITVVKICTEQAPGIYFQAGLVAKLLYTFTRTFKHVRFLKLVRFKILP